MFSTLKLKESGGLKMNKDNNFLSVEVGDTIVCIDEYDKDCNHHLLLVQSIDYDRDNATKTNPRGMTLYGIDLEEDEWGDDYVVQATETTFISIARKVANDTEKEYTRVSKSRMAEIIRSLIRWMDDMNCGDWNITEETLTSLNIESEELKEISKI